MAYTTATFDAMCFEGMMLGFIRSPDGGKILGKNITHWSFVDIST